VVDKLIAMYSHNKLSLCVFRLFIMKVCAVTSQMRRVVAVHYVVWRLGKTTCDLKT